MRVYTMVPMIGLLLSCGLASAQSDGGNCWGLALPEQLPAQLLKVQDSKVRLHFVKNQSDAEGCPAPDSSCQRRAFVVPGDVVIGIGEHSGFVCAGFVGKGGRITTGWLPADALDSMPEQSLSVADWAGEWVRDAEADLQIQALDQERIAVVGTATWGSGDPERVARGGVNIGEIERTELAVEGAVVHLQSGLGAIDPEQAEEYSCVLSLQRIGEALLARDNSHCGGMNVRFDGVYLRK